LARLAAIRRFSGNGLIWLNRAAAGRLMACRNDYFNWRACPFFLRLRFPSASVDTPSSPDTSPYASAIARPRMNPVVFRRML
jgi:hypothetical protein